jgi:hypothetical protein
MTSLPRSRSEGGGVNELRKGSLTRSTDGDDTRPSAATAATVAGSLLSSLTWNNSWVWCVGCLAVVTTALHLGFGQSPMLQNTVWQMMSIGMLGPGVEPGVGSLAGVPALCGNAAPLQTLSWMNPADFNRSTVGVVEVERLLHVPAPDAPIFVVGCGHSGTTELITLLDRHPLITAYLDGPGMEFAIQPNSFASPWPRWLPVGSRHDDRTFDALARRKVRREGGTECSQCIRRRNALIFYAIC